MTNLGERVSTVEAGLRSLGEQMIGLRGDIASIANSIAAAQRTNWPTLISGALLIMAIFGAGLTPIYLASGYAHEQAKEALEWQKEYMLGRVPAAAAPAMAEMKQQFIEVETQFRAFKERMIENETFTREWADRNYKGFMDARERADTNRIAIARLEEQMRSSNGNRGGTNHIP